MYVSRPITKLAPLDSLDDARERRRVDAELVGNPFRLRDELHVGCEERVVDELHRERAAERGDREDRVGVRGDGGACPFDVGGRAAEHDGERAGEDVVGAAAERRVDDVAVACRGDALDGRRAAGGVRHEQRVVGQVRDETVVVERDRRELLVGVHAHVHDLRDVRGVGQRVGDRRARRGEVLAHLGPAGVHGDVVTRSQQPLRHGRADLARPHERDAHGATRAGGRWRWS